MSNKVTLVFGKQKDTEKYVEYPLNHVLVTGGAGTGKSMLIHNILDSMLLRYGSEDVEILYWDDEVVEVADTYGRTSLIKTYVPVADEKFENFLLTVSKEVQSRYYFTSFEKPVIVVIDHLDTCLNDSCRDVLTHLMVQGLAVSVYFILGTMRPDYFFTRFAEYICDFRGYPQLHINGGEETITRLEKRDFIFKQRFCETTLLHAPFYPRQKKIDICKGNLLPNGTKFTAERLYQYAIANDIDNVVY